MNYTLGPFMEPMLEELAWSRRDFTLPRTLSQFVMAGVGLLIGGWVDRFGPRRFMSVGMVVLSGALYSCSQVTTLTQWILLNGVVLTMGSALIGNLVVNVTLAKWFVERRGTASALAAMGISFAGVALVPAVTYAIDAQGWREAWQWLAGFALLAMIPVVLLMRRAPEDYGLHPDGKSDAEVAGGLALRAEQDFSNSMTRAEAVRTASFYYLVVAFGCFSAGIAVMLLQTVPYVTDAGFSRTNAALMLVIASVPALVSKPIWGYFIDRSNAPRPLAALSAVLTGLATALIVVAQAQASLVGLYVGYFVLGIGWGGMIPLQEVIWAGFFGRRYLGAVRSAALPIALLISAPAPWLTSWYYDLSGNYTFAIAVMAGVNLVAAVLIMLIPTPSHPAGATINAA